MTAIKTKPNMAEIKKSLITAFSERYTGKKNGQLYAQLSVESGYNPRTIEGWCKPTKMRLDGVTMPVNYNEFELDKQIAQ